VVGEGKRRGSGRGEVVRDAGQCRKAQRWYAVEWVQTRCMAHTTEPFSSGLGGTLLHGRRCENNAAVMS